MNQLPLIRDSSIVISEVSETLDRLYAPIAQDADWYFERMKDLKLPLTTASIKRLKERLEYANHRTHQILGHVRMGSGGLYPLTEIDILNIADQAWVSQVTADKKVEKLLRHTSFGMNYFPKTFHYIENIDPYRFDKISYQEKLALLEIAGNERDSGIQKERPRLAKITHSYRHAISELISRIKMAVHCLDIEATRHVKMGSLYEANSDFPSLGLSYPSNSVNPKLAELGYLEYQKALLHQSYLQDSYKILERFIFEESELVVLLSRWLGMAQMYRVADISEYFHRRFDPVTNPIE